MSQVAEVKRYMEINSDGFTDLRCSTGESMHMPNAAIAEKTVARTVRYLWKSELVFGNATMLAQRPMNSRIENIYLNQLTDATDE